MFIFGENHYYTKIWFIYGGVPLDLMACLFREKDGPWTVRFRVRLYMSDPGKDPFHDDDQKIWKQRVMHGVTEEEALAFANKFFRGAQQVLQCEKMDELNVASSNMDYIIGQMRQHEWFHEKTVDVTNDMN